ncbi:MAG: SGNH/GDSL hydrolase family protein [Phycisphaerales bacterium]
MRSIVAWVACVALVVVSGGVARGQEGADHRKVIKTRDTVLFLGDSLLAQSGLSSQVSAGILRVRTGEQVRTYTASWDGAIVADGAAEAGKGRAESAILWVPRVALSTRPTILVMAFGWDDALRRGGAEGEAFEKAYEEGLEHVLKTIRHRVREVFLVTPPADGPDGVLNDRERARLASIAAATARVAGRVDARVVSLQEGGVGRGIVETWDGASGARFEGAPSVIAASCVLRAIGFSAEELSRVGWAPCPEPVFERARGHLALDVSPVSGEVSRTFRLTQALRTYNTDYELLWRDMEMRLAVTNERREDILSWQRIEVERDWVGVERIAAATEEVDAAH